MTIYEHKAEYIRLLMKNNPKWTNSKIAKEVKCSVRTVDRFIAYNKLKSK
jgi:transcriptional antiterminator